MEDVVRAPEEKLIRAFTFLGLVDKDQPLLQRGVATALAAINRKTSRIAIRAIPLPVSVAMEILRRNAFSLKSNGRAPGAENVSSHYRKGVPGDWVNHFSAGHSRRFKERYGELLVRLGYERDLDW
jgi:hypothetical protein